MKKYLLFLLVIHVTFCLAQRSMDRFYPPQELMPVGVYYYPEHWERSQWERDIRRIKELGFSFTHYGEFAWAQLEPEEGKFDFRWLDEAVKIASDIGLKIIMCTPSPCPPVWLTQKHPEILVVDEKGVQRKHGIRLHANAAHPTYQKYIKRIVTELGKRYGNHPAVVGWQIDNEPHFDTQYDYSEYSKKAFREWVKKKYNNDIKALNKAWGLAFWSGLLNNFEQIEIPNKVTGALASSPHAILDFKRFNAEQVAKGIQFQAAILRKIISPQQYITTNYAYYKFLPSVDIFLTKHDLDFATHTMYLLSQWLNNPEGELGHRLGSGMELSFSSELARSVNGATAIMELQPGQINWGKFNPQPLPGAVRMWLWHSFGLGDRFACTYRFRQPLYGGEMYHAGIMETDGVTLARGGKEYVQFIKEIEQLKTKYASTITNVAPQEIEARRTAFLWNMDNQWETDEQKQSDRYVWWNHIYTYYEVLKSMGCPVTFLQESDTFDAQKYPFMVAPSYQLIDKHLIDKWKRYVEEGGHLILTCRTGEKNKHGQFHEALRQQPIWELIGAKILYFDMMPAEQNATIAYENKTAAWNIWADILEAYEGTEILATYADQFYKGAPAVVTRKLKKGTVTYIGAWSQNKQLENDILRTVYKRAQVKILNLPYYVFTEWRSGFWVTVNYTSQRVEAPVHEKATILYGNKEVEPGEVCVWIEN
ncbi:MAG: beta-galactosidase [Cytophagales bacterium]|nr:beta-galactosidase [Cytophagales bacterium]MDW8385109.1 beta-galactosidase [Flammeovirgaceae bacterium]